LCYDIQLSKGGLDISVQGYGHRLPVLLEKIAGEIQRVSQNSSSHALSGDLFQLMKEKTLRSLKNYLFWQPYYHSMLGSLLCLEDGRYSSSEKHQSLSAASFDDFQSFAAQLVKQMKAQVSLR
jgi:insulysin